MAVPASVPPPAESTRREAPQGPRSWPWWTGIAALGLAFVAASLLGVAVVSIVVAFGYGTVDNPSKGANLGAVVFQDLAFVVMPVVLVVSRSRGPVLPWMLGLRRPKVKTALVWMALAYLGLLAFGLVWSQLVKYSDDSKVADDLPVIGGAVVACVLAPIAEETLFRGFIFPSLRNKVGLVGGILITGGMFGAIHVGSAKAGALVPLALFGALLCVVYWQTGSLLPCMLCHCVNNCIAYGALEHWSWQIGVALVLAVGTILGLYRVVESRFGVSGVAPRPV